ncbi:unnamed protein product [marine sediment metagenome]|uniref:Uncharacterized protein n=1 Tax=marine sediment metagenome TaxID=412755 RepID=X0W0W7_9ZZZZ
MAKGTQIIETRSKKRTRYEKIELRKSQMLDIYLRPSAKNSSWSNEKPAIIFVIEPAGEIIENRYRELMRIVEEDK